jgi:hypothetical protein
LGTEVLHPGPVWNLIGSWPAGGLKLCPLARSLGMWPAYPAHPQHHPCLHSQCTGGGSIPLDFLANYNMHAKVVCAPRLSCSACCVLRAGEAAGEPRAEPGAAGGPQEVPAAGAGAPPGPRRHQVCHPAPLLSPGLSSCPPPVARSVILPPSCCQACHPASLLSPGLSCCGAETKPLQRDQYLPSCVPLYLTILHALPPPASPFFPLSSTQCAMLWTDGAYRGRVHMRAGGRLQGPL